MKKNIIFSNSLHNVSISIEINFSKEGDATLTKEQTDQIYAALCDKEGCACQGCPDTNGSFEWDYNREGTLWVRLRNFSRAGNKTSEKCKFCNSLRSEDSNDSKYFHKGKWVCDNCWDERLTTTK